MSDPQRSHSFLASWLPGVSPNLNSSTSSPHFYLPNLNSSVFLPNLNSSMQWFERRSPKGPKQWRDLRPWHQVCHHQLHNNTHIRVTQNNTQIHLIHINKTHALRVCVEHTQSTYFKLYWSSAICAFLHTLTLAPLPSSKWSRLIPRGLCNWPPRISTFQVLRR